jgi:3-oxoadipate enol-lactonase
MMKTKTFKRGATTLRYHEVGAGEPLVLIQGLGMPGIMWEELAGELAALGMRVLMPDNRGTGGSARMPVWAYSVEDMADDVAGAMADAGIDRALVAGYSLGGMIAQHVALRHPERVSGLFLAATTCGLPHGRIASPTTIMGLLKLFLKPSTVTPELVESVMTHPDARPRLKEIFDGIEARLKPEPTPPGAIIGQLLAASHHSTGFRLGRIKAPTWVVTGDSDRLIPPSNSDTLSSRIPGAHLERVARSGHLFAYEHPGALRDLILAWRAQVNEARAAA